MKNNAKTKKIIISTASLLLIILAVSVYYYYYDLHSGIKQPIPFSHKVHVSEEKIKCETCHEGLFENNKAGIPAEQICMNCHEKMTDSNSSIEYVREHLTAGKPIEWKKVTSFDEYVNFSHSVHIKRGVDCSKCHGNVAEMNRVKEEVFMDMKFCIGCHNESNVKVDCSACHN